MKSITLLKTEFSGKKKQHCREYSSQSSVDELGINASQFTASRFYTSTETLKSSHRLVNASKRRTQKKMLVSSHQTGHCVLFTALY